MKRVPLTRRLLADINATGPGTYREIACCTRKPLKLVAGTLSNLRKQGELVIVGRVSNGRGTPAAIYGTPAQAHTPCRSLQKIFKAA